MDDYPTVSMRQQASGLTRRQFLSVVCLFWAYVTVSNVLYAYAMRTGIAHLTTLSLFAPWDARVLQHLMLLPFLMVSYLTSQRIQWRPVLVAIPLQIILGLAFAAIAYPAMIVGEFLVGDSDFHHKMQAHSMSPWADPEVLSLWLASFVSFLPTYGFGLALVTGLSLYARFRNLELQRTALEREFSAARLAALRMQLSPHTLFNLLHTIRGHIEWDPKGAQTMVVQLADLLRRLLNAGERDYSRLADELQFVRLYLELQQKRFADRLTVILPAPSDIVDAWVPSLILQPLVENAVVHGLAGHQGPVVVRVAVKRVDEMLVIRVSNTIAPDRTSGSEGIGLKNVRERLAVQFDGRAGLAAAGAGAEWVSEITMPEIHASPDRRSARRASSWAAA
ncbi:MAG TPA: histidine kinase [Steroidobacteraceae bacterium]|nr:histidine kinase [Steroidobacteraceae bacterium]